MALVTFQIDAGSLSATQLQQVLRPTQNSARQSLNRIMRLVQQIRSGRAGLSAAISVLLGGVRAAGALTFTDEPSNNETFVLANTTFTAKTSGASGAAEWNITTGGSSAADAAGNAASVAALINAHPTVSAQVTAAAALGVVTLTAVDPGVAGNAIQLSEALSNATITAFSGGSDGTRTELTL